MVNFSTQHIDLAIPKEISTTGIAINALKDIQTGAAVSTTQLAAAFSALTPAQIANLVATNNLSNAQLKEALSTSTLTLEQKKEVWALLESTAAKGTDTAATNTLSFSMKGFTVAILDNVKAMLVWLATNPVGWIMLAVGAIAGAIAIYNKYNKAIQESIEKAHELQDAYKEASAEISNNISTVKDLADEFDKLSRGVGDHGENISLSSDEYDRYLDIVDQLVELNPTLVKGYTAEGNAIVNKNSAIQDTIDLLKEQNALELEKATSDDTNWEIAEGLKNAYKQALSDIEDAQFELKDLLTINLSSSLLNDTQNTLSKLEEIFGVSLEGYAGIDTGDDISALLDIIFLKSKNATQAVKNNIAALSELAGGNTDFATELQRSIKTLARSESIAETAATAYQSQMKLIAQASPDYSSLTDGARDFLNTWIETFKLTKDTSESEISQLTIDLERMVSSLANNRELSTSLSTIFTVDLDTQEGGYRKYWESKINEVLAELQDELDLSDEEVVKLKVAMGLVIVDPETGKEIDARSYYIAQLQKRGLGLGAEDLDGFSTADLRLMLNADVDGMDDVSEFADALSKVKETAAAAEDALADFSTLTKHLAKDTDTLYAALAKLKSGNISAIFEEENLDDLLDKFPDLIDELDAYAKGLITDEQLQRAFNDAIADFNADAIYNGISDVVDAAEEYGAESNQVKQAVQNLSSTIPGLVNALYDEETGHLKVDGAALLSANSLYDVVDATLEAERAAKNADLSNAVQELEKLRDAAIEAAGAYFAVRGAINDDLVDQVWSYNAQIDQALQEYYDALESNVTAARKRYNRTSSSSSSSSDPWKEKFEAYYNAHKHAVAMEQETLADFYAWLDGQDGYKKYFANNVKYLDEYRKYAEEVFEGLRDLADDAINDGEHQICLWENQGGHEEDIVRKYRELQAQVHETAESIRAAMRDAGWSELEIENSEIVQSLSKQWWSFEDTIKDVFDSVSDTIDDHINDMEHQIYLLEQQAGDTGDNDGAILAHYTGLKAYILKMIDEITAKMKALGYTEMEIANSGAIQELQKQLWGVEDSIDDILDTLNGDLYDSMQSLLDLTIEMIKQEAEDEKEALEKIKDEYQEIISLRKEMLQLAERERQYQEDVDDKTSEISKIQARIDALSLDDSRAAAIERAALEEKLADLQRELTDLQRDHAIESTEDQLDRELDDFEAAQNEKIQAIDDFLDNQQALTQAALARLDNMNQSLFDDLLSYALRYTSTTQVEFEEMWNAALDGAQNYASFLDAMNAAQAGNYYTASGFGSTSGTSANVSLVQDLIDKMKANSASWFTSSDPSSLDSQNKTYAAQISALLGGASVTRDNKGVWWIDGQELYEITEEALEKYNKAVKEFDSFGTVGSYFAVPSSSASPGASENRGSFGSSSKKDSSSVSSEADIIAQMKANAAAWQNASQSIREDLVAENERLAKQLSKLMEIDIVKGNDGRWYYGYVGGIPLFHGGGIAGASTSQQDELFALIKNKEMILTETQQHNLMAMLEQLKPLNALKEALTSFRSGAVEMTTAGIAPNIDASLSINGYVPDDQMMGVLQRHERKVANMIMKYFAK